MCSEAKSGEALVGNYIVCTVLGRQCPQSSQAFSALDNEKQKPPRPDGLSSPQTTIGSMLLERSPAISFLGLLHNVQGCPGWGRALVLDPLRSLYCSWQMGEVPQ